MGPGGVDSIKSEEYNLMVVRSCPATNILDLDILVKLRKIFEKLHKKYMKRMSRHVDG